ncbi:hypothetical protein CUU66_15615 [Peribacillus deserti]|uniref:Uncharacterized protein n=1 Tax=Peribacillus deserti TaxID=673318 RepID=A0A2N5M3H7_9BACI|nr:hypothetical protein CUU66_15615 [Peribacillus deserti]
MAAPAIHYIGYFRAPSIGSLVNLIVFTQVVLKPPQRFTKISRLSALPAGIWHKLQRSISAHKTLGAKNYIEEIGKK